MIKSKRIKSAEMAAYMDEIDAQMKSLRRGFQPGEKVLCTVVSVEPEFIVLDTNSKIPGIVETSQFQDVPSPAAGDVIELYFTGIRDGAARFALKGAAAAGTDVCEAVREAYVSRLPVEGRVVKAVNGGLEVSISGHRAFCPYSQWSVRRGSNESDDGSDSRIGATAEFMILECDPECRNVVVSRRAAEERERENLRKSLRDRLKIGDEVEGVVVKVMPFGAFVDIGGADGLIPAPALTWDKSLKPDDVVSVGDKVKVTVTGLDWEAGRIELSLRVQADDPWIGFEEEFGPGSYVSGTVTKIMPYGVFVRLASGVDGFVHVSKLGIKHRVSSPAAYVKIGQELDMVIESVDSVSRRISLRAVTGDEVEKETEETENTGEYLEKNRREMKSSGLGSLGSMFGDILK